jgi:hypothetical protein
LPPFSFSPTGDTAARQQVVSNDTGRPGMAVISSPIPDNPPDDPVVYAPLTVSGLTIGFNIERNPDTTAPADAQQLAGVRIAQLNLTPRLVAKLLTQSYKAAVSIYSTPAYPWLASNPAHMGADPDFLRFNPEFAQQQISDSRTFSGLQLPAGNADAIQQLWAWILADPEAKAWVAGAPDEWGMTVNPVYLTDAAKNPTGVAFADPLPTSFPKSDPYCYQAPNHGTGVVPPELCGTDWLPYTRGLSDSAAITRAAADGAKIDDNPFAAASSEVWTRELPQFLGRRDMLAVTDTPSAAQFGLQVASLSRAGDNGPNRAFVAPDTATMTHAVGSMKVLDEPQVLQPDPAAQGAGDYPLTVLTYGAVRPLSLSAAERQDFSSFVTYATGQGQTPGLELGQLPRGYAPLPANLKSAAQAASSKIVTLVAPPTTTTTEQVDSSGGFTGGGGGSGGFTGGGSDDGSGTADTTPVDTVTIVIVNSTVTTVPTTDDTVPETTVVLTPSVASSSSRLAVPGLGFMALGSALGALEITKRPRRRSPLDTDAPDGVEED